jgi:DNA-directed RNA polymerase beta subunit
MIAMVTRLQRTIHRTGDELMYNPHDGRQNTRPVNLCPTYYLLSQMVADKMVASNGRGQNEHHWSARTGS